MRKAFAPRPSRGTSDKSGTRRNAYRASAAHKVVPSRRAVGAVKQKKLESRNFSTRKETSNANRLERPSKGNAKGGATLLRGRCNRCYSQRLQLAANAACENANLGDLRLWPTRHRSHARRQANGGLLWRRHE